MTTKKEISRNTSWTRIAFRVLVFSLICGAGGVTYLKFLSRDLPSLEQLENFDPDLVTRIYSADGVLLKELYTQRRVFVDLDRIPKQMVDAVIASEDHRFRSHWGISLRDVARAVVINTLTLSYRQGFSSITQQLARNLYDTIGFKKTITRKIKEIITAIQIEKTYTKDEILEMYLNSIHFGHGTYGVQAASKRYFQKDALDITLDESALLAGLLPAPAHYSPINYPEEAIRRRNTVLRLMNEHGLIMQSAYLEAKALPLEVSQDSNNLGLAPYFSEHIRRLLEREDKELDIDIYRDGLEIYTTLDSRIQSAAEEAVLKSVKRNQAILNKRLYSDREEFEQLAYLGIYPEDSVRMMLNGEMALYEGIRTQLLVQTAFIAIDPTNGYIKAMIGGRPDYHDQFNRAVQAKRQPGSVFKPFIYTAAIDNGYPVTRQLLNQPVVLNVQNADGLWEKWMPKNYDLSTGGLTTLREGLRRSLNLISVRLVQELVPPEVVVQTAKRMHITTPLRAVDAIALGTSEVIPLEITSAYATFANKGVWCAPIAITKIVDRFGVTIKEYHPKREEVLSEETAFIMTDLLRTVVDRGTGGSIRWKYRFNKPAGGKTGTTQGWTDAWFVGFTPHLAAGVWMGIDDPSVSLGKKQDGGRAALPAWANFMNAVYDTMGWERKDFEVPEGVSKIKICQVTKDLPTKYCPTEKEWFIDKYAPFKTCLVHTEASTRRSRDRGIDDL
ncbi:MAG: PBP1A family penicillin-binding protein [Candidatus Marinimicrobia bacterium]|nr:PBP1A family penicillin-binding protein [Candidatus Neomarinimicrobiota bacterium]